MTPPRPGLAAPVLAGVALAALGMWLMLHRLGVPGAASDEIVYVHAAQSYLQGDFSPNQEHPPLGKWLIVAGLRPGLSGDELLAAARLPGALLGWLTGVVCAATAGLLTRRWAAALGAGGLWWLLPGANGPPHHLVRVAMLEAPMLFFLSLSLLLWVVAWRTRDLRWWPVAAVAVGLATASKLPGLVGLVGLAPVSVAALLRPGVSTAARGRVLLLAVGCAGLAAATFLATYLPAGGEAAAWARHTFAFQLTHAAEGHAVEIGGEVRTTSPWWAAWWWQSRYLTWAGVAVLWALAALGLARWRRHGAWVVGAPLVAGALVLGASALQLPHYHLLLVPMLVVSAGAALAAPPSARPARSRAVSVAAALALVVLLPVVVQHAAAVARTRGSPFAAAAEELESRGLGAATLTVWADPFAVNWYLPDRDRTIRPPAAEGVVLVNESYARRRGFPFEEWCAEECALRERVDLGGVTLYLPATGIP